MARITRDQLAQKMGHLSLAHFPDLELGSNTIVWSPNGTGKSSLYNALRELSQDGRTPGMPSMAFADLDNSREDFKKNGSTLEFGLGIQRIEELEAENRRILADAKVSDRFRAVGIGTMRAAKKALPAYPRCPVRKHDDQENALLAYKRAGTERVASALVCWLGD